ncbi:MFS transporter [Halioglobus maricola]|uniref:MFS transporter n=1 Tax=Halioglobus maricola TaxID=2601894 RepID=A0A5P9NLU5_9GAMM|nr:MFS transporter [Halioglobus maricola]QFU76476.1 MFS transporter [Halioglobus maricola]
MSTPVRFLGIDLSDGVKKHHLLAYLVAAFVSSSYAGALAMLQPGLLQVMGIERAAQATLTGNLSALQEVVLILFMGPIGALADRYGRRPVYAFGLLATAIGFALYPHADSISELVAYRIIVAFGGAAMVGMMVTVIADYTCDSTRGKANGLQALIATLGAFLPPMLGALPQLFVNQGYDQLAAQQITFAIAGSLGVFGTLVVIVGLAPHVGKATHAAGESIATMMREGLKHSRDPGIALSYGAAFISRGDLAVTGAFLSLWLVQFGTGVLGLEPSQAMFELAVPRVLMVVTGALIGSLLMGYINDRVSRVTAVTLASGLAAAVYLSIFFVDDPTAPWVFGLLAVMGVAEISAFVSSQALVGERANPERRGAIIGLFGVAGAVGILVGTAGGGWLFATFGPSTPFVLFGVLNGVVFVWSMLVRRAEKA